MNQYLKELVSLCEFDKKIDGYAPKIDEINRKLTAQKDEIKAIDANISNIDNEINEIKAQITSTNAHISEFNAKIKSISKKSGSVKSEKEAKALNLEEDLAKDQLEAANDEVARLERVIESKKLLKADLATKKTELKSNLKELEAATKDELKSLEKERENIYKEKEKLLKQMNQKVLTFYEKIRKWAKNTSIVPMRKQACYGCFMKINDKTYANIIQSDEIVTCPHCGRILYKESE